MHKKEIENYLELVKMAIKKGRYKVSLREKNSKLFEDYLITEKKREEILLSLSADDFCKMVQNEHEKFQDEYLYIFGKDIILLPRYHGDEKMVHLYIKINQLKNYYCIVVSFHEQEYPLSYAFK